MLQFVDMIQQLILSLVREFSINEVYIVIFAVSVQKVTFQLA